MTETKIKGLKTLLTSTNMRIIDSYQITDIKKMKEIITEALNKESEYTSLRSINSFVREWITHNRFYKIHILRTKTKDCDFESSLNPILAILYFICSISFKKITFFKKIRENKMIKKQEEKYNKYIEEHRNNVMKAYNELISCSLVYQYGGQEMLDKLKDRIVLHDLSKYEEEEYDAYRKNFFPINQEEKENNKEAFEKAWQHHWKNNSHHWQYRQNNKDFSQDNIEDVLNVLENICDWLAMGYKFNDRPYQYYEKNKDKIILNEKEKRFLEHIIYEGIDVNYIKREIGMWSGD